jgi:hypothetical protein
MVGDSTEQKEPAKSQKAVQWIDSYWTFLVALVVLGPLALPLLWRNPRLSRSVKIWGSGVILVLTALLCWFSVGYLQDLRRQLEELKVVLESSPS